MAFKRGKRRGGRFGTPAGTIHLVRHGEVENPDHVVYAGMPGFSLSEDGKLQAAAVANRLGSVTPSSIVSSPLDRAIETANAIAAPHGLAVDVDDRLSEWALSDRWAGVAWDDLPDRFPGELEAYLSNPSDLSFSPESIADVAARVAASITEYRQQHESGDLIVVGHQDPLHAGELMLTGRSFEDFHTGKQGHGAVVTLISNIASDHSSDGDWIAAGSWEPQQTEPFPPIDQT